MSVDRPTFSESWHRVAEMRPRLRTAVQTYRQQFRGRTWHVLADPANNQHYRLDDAAYHILGLLDGRRTVAEAWDISNEALGDRAATQGEVIQLLGQLYASNLIQAELSPDVAQMFERHAKRRRREIGGYLTNFLFIRIPLFDPHRILQRWVGLVGWVFGPVGWILWLALLVTAGYFLTGRYDDLLRGADPQILLRAENLVWLYLSFAVIKAIHEFGHGFACEHFGRRSGSGGPVHTMGIMFLVFMPVPYVDASSSWAFRNKWHRAFVGAAGMYVELAVAAVAAIVWTQTADGTIVNTIAYNVIFIASISTLLFNGNPLLRFDGYYILSDLLEIANLSQRSKQYVYYLVRKYVYGVRAARSVAHTAGERWWLGTYCIAATIYRVFICFAILLFIADVMFILGAIMAIAALIMWVVVPLGKYIKYLALDPELERVRSRAVTSTAAFFALVFVLIGGIPMPDRDRAEGVVEPVRLVVAYMSADGFVESVLPSGTPVGPGGPALLSARNRALETEQRELIATIRAVDVRRAVARRDSPAVEQALTEQIETLRKRLQRVQKDLSGLQPRAPFDGVWVSPDVEQYTGVYLRRGQEVGLVADPSDLLIRVAADQTLGPRIEHELGVGDQAVVELRVRGRPDIYLTGTVRKVLPAGQSNLPSASLGYVAGGSMAVAADDSSGTKTTEPFFEVHIRPDLTRAQVMGDADAPLLIGQRVVVRFSMPDKPLMKQWWRALRQLIQRRFTVAA